MRICLESSLFTFILRGIKRYVANFSRKKQAFHPEILLPWRGEVGRRGHQ
jgi:hypothetical protein